MSEERTRDKEPLFEENERPACFGDPQRVCPVDDDGFMQPQTACISCSMLKSCLRSALSKQGIIAPKSGQGPAVSRMTGFLRRWSDQKLSAGKATGGMREK